MAPPNNDCFYVLAPVPNQLSGIDWRARAKPFRNAVIQFLDAHYLPGLLDDLVTEQLSEHQLDFEDHVEHF